jgi:hypothetical protein
VADLVKSLRRSDMRACHAMDRSSTTKRWIKRTTFTIGFDDDETINDHKVINGGQLVGFSNNDPQSQDDAGLQDRDDDP